jgi:(2Fe-2S) ferredoxin
MSRRLDRWRSERQADRTTVVVCRGGDCGSRRKHPGFDHQGQLARFREGLDGEQVAVVVSRCLDACEFSNVVVVQPGARDGAQRAEPVWLGEVLDDATTEGVVDWVQVGGPVADPPPAVQAHRFQPDLKSRGSLAGARRRPSR